MIRVKWVHEKHLQDECDDPHDFTRCTRVIELAALRVTLCAYCKKGLLYKNGFHSGHSKSRDYFKACDADALLGMHFSAQLAPQKED